jgi:chromosome partitioning protein
MTKASALKTIAVYSMKGGVGKTTFAVNLAWASATLSRRRTLLWDLDPQAASTYLMDHTPVSRDAAQAVFSKDVDPLTLVRPTGVDGLDLLGADTSLRKLDRLLFDLGKRKRLARLLEGLAGRYERVILDCPPGLTETSEQVLNAADIIIVPVIPSPLAMRALTDVADFLVRWGGRHPPMLPVYSLVDKRRTIHKGNLSLNPDWPVVPYASTVEQMAERRLPLGAFAPRSAPTQAFAQLWAGIEHRLARD